MSPALETRAGGGRPPGGSTARSLACAAVALLPASGCSGGVADSEGSSREAACGTPATIAELPEALREASGITRDPRRDDLFWIQNDSDNDAVLFAVDATGDVLGSTPVRDATNRDVEDLATARCPEGWCLFYADMGDNQGLRDRIYVHRLPLPPLPTDAAVPSEPVRPLATYELTYPSGGRDAESLFVDATREELGIITKGREDVVELYRAELATLEASAGPVELQRVGRLRLPIGANSGQFVTAADLSPDGRRLAVRSYTTLYLYEWDGFATFDTLAAPAAESLLPAFEPQGEGVTFTRDGAAMYLASEGTGSRRPQLSRIECRP